jgi:hypothetical protein
MIQRDPGGISKVDQEELDNEGVIVHSTCSAHEAVILHLDVGDGFAIILDDVAWRSKMLWAMSVTHGASKRLWTRPFKTEIVSITIIIAIAARVSRMSLGLRVIIPWVVPSVHLRL